MKTIDNYEKREREVFSFNIQNLKVDECHFSENGSFSPWDVKYKRDGEWFASNIKIFKHNSYEFFDFSKWNPSWSSNPIGGHPIKEDVMNKLMRIMNSERVSDSEVYYEQEIPFINYYRPTIIFFFGDGVVLEWNIDELPLAWDPVSNGFIKKYFVNAWNPKTQEDTTLVNQLFYGLDPLKAQRWDWKEPVRLWRGRNEDHIQEMNEGEWNEKDLH